MSLPVCSKALLHAMTHDSITVLLFCAHHLEPFGFARLTWKARAVGICTGEGIGFTALEILFFKLTSSLTSVYESEAESWKEGTPRSIKPDYDESRTTLMKGSR